MATAQSFPRFSSLPLELQYQIWDYAIKDVACTRRVQRIAHHRSRTHDNYVLRIANQPHAVPFPLHTCAYTRRLGLEIYTLWATAYGDGERKVYVNKAADVFYFGGEDGIQFWLMAAVYECFLSESSSTPNPDFAAFAAESLVARQKVREQMRGCQHFAFNFEIYRSTFGKPIYQRWRLRELWFDTLPDIERMTLVRQVPELDEAGGDALKRRLASVPSHYFMQDYLMRQPGMWRSEWRYILDLRDFDWDKNGQRTLEMEFAIAVEDNGGELGREVEWLGYCLKDLGEMEVHEW